MASTSTLEQIDILLAKLAGGLRKQNPDGVTDGIVSHFRKDIVSILETDDYAAREELVKKLFSRLDGIIKTSRMNGMDLETSCTIVELKGILRKETKLIEANPRTVEGFIATLMASIKDEEKRKEIEITEKQSGPLKMTDISTHGLNGIFLITLAYEVPERIQMIMLGGAVRWLAESFSGNFYGLPCRIIMRDTETLYGHLTLQVLY